MPLSLGATAQVDLESIQRLKRMREHANFAAALAFVPRDPRVERRAAGLLTYGSVAIVLGVIAGLVTLVAWWRGWNVIVPGTIAGMLVLVAVVLYVLPASMRRASDARPLLKRPALVVLRRSEMAEDGGTNYYFTLRFDDGSEGEFHRPGLGTMHEPMANGYSGIAYTRGADLVDFRRLG